MSNYHIRVYKDDEVIAEYDCNFSNEGDAKGSIGQCHDGLKIVADPY